MNQATEFKTIEEAEEKIKRQLSDLCNQFKTAIKQILPVLKKSSETSKMTPKDTCTFKDLYDEGNDHLHNLVQLDIELNVSNENAKEPLILEVSSEVLRNAAKYIKELPKNLENTNFIQAS